MVEKSRSIIPTIKLGKLILDIEDGAVTHNDKLAYLSPNEIALLAVLMLAREVVSNEEIVKRTVGHDIPNENRYKLEKGVGPLISSLKRKLNRVGIDNPIQNKYGYGYKLINV